MDTAHPAIGVAVASGLSDAAADSLGSDEAVEVVEQDVEFKAFDPIEEAPAEVAAVEDASAEDELASPTQPATATFYALQQWNMEKAIKAKQAWDAGRLGSSNVTVAILDTGIDGGTNASGTNAHLDLQGRVDRSRSKSFVPKTLEDPKAFFGPNTPEWADLHFHGTHVASTVSSNANRVAGVTSKVNLMAVKVFDRNENGSTARTLDGIMYAADNGADVINMSLGATSIRERRPTTSWRSLLTGPSTMRRTRVQ